MPTEIMDLIARAPWREAVTYSKTWPHEYVVIRKDSQQELLAAFCVAESIREARASSVGSSTRRRNYLFLGDHQVLDR